MSALAEDRRSQRAVAMTGSSPDGVAGRLAAAAKAAAAVIANQIAADGTAKPRPLASQPSAAPPRAAPSVATKAVATPTDAAPKQRRRRLFSPPEAEKRAAPPASSRAVREVTVQQPRQAPTGAPTTAPTTAREELARALQGEVDLPQPPPPLRAVHGVATVHARRIGHPLGRPSPGNKFGLDKSISLAVAKGK